jgi:hypothetical protein
MARYWAEVGFGTPVALHLFYVVKILLYILGAGCLRHCPTLPTMFLCTCIAVSVSTPDEPVSVWFDRDGRLMSDLGAVDTTCFARVHSGHCPDRRQCVVLDRAPGPRLLFGSELMSDIDDEAGIYLETHAKHLEPDLISITVDHVGDSGPGSWRYRLLAMRWKTDNGPVDTTGRLAVWPD